MVDDRVFLVTGGTSGIGRATVLGLAQQGATVLVHGRDRVRGEAVCETVRTETPGRAELSRADFTHFDAVEDLAQTVLSDYDRLDGLVANAAVWKSHREFLGVEGPRSDGTWAPIEMTVGVNHCAHALLIDRLEDRLLDSAGRLVVVASQVYRNANWDLDGFTGPDGPSGQDAYALSKLANLLYALALARRHDDTALTVSACHPGVVPSTRLARESGPILSAIWTGMGIVGRVLPFGFIDDEREAAQTQLFLASDPDATRMHGEYVVDCEPRKPATIGTDRARQVALWEWTQAVLDRAE